MSTGQQQRQQQYDDYDTYNQQQPQQYSQLNALQQQFIQKQMNSAPIHQNYIDNNGNMGNDSNSAYGSQLQSNLVSGRYPQISNLNNQVDSQRNNLGGFNMQTPSQQNQKGMQQMYPQNILSQFSATAGVGQLTHPQPDLNLMSQFSMKDGPGSMTPSANIGAFGGGNANMFSSNLGALQQGIQPNLLQELLKMQGNLGGVSSLGTQQQQQNNQPVFGQGFMNAASLLANIQQLQQPGDKQPSTPLQQPNNMLAIQQLMNINQNMSQYQQFIDQIDKQQPVQQLSHFGAPSNYGVSGPAPSNARASQQPISQISSPIQNMPSYSSTLPTQAPSYLSQANPTPLNSSMLPSQSDLIRQPLKTSAQNYHDMVQMQQETQQPAPQHSNYSYLMNNKAAYEMHQQQQNEQENHLQASQNSKNDQYLYQEVKNTVSNPLVKERPAYNPNAYSNNNSKKPNMTLSGDEYSYEGQQQSYSVQKSPSGLQKVSIPQAASRRNNEENSPKVQWLSGNNARSTQNEPLSYLSNNYGAQKFSDGQSSPPHRNSANRAFQNDIYSGQNPQQNQLDSSFNRQAAMNVPIVYQLNASQNSSQIEHHMSGNFSKQQPNHYNQQSPGGSSNFRYNDDAPHQNPDSSVNFGRSQRLGTANNMSQQAINIDDIPIGASKPKTFEEILEENLRKMGQDPSAVVPDSNPQSRVREDDEGRKKEFLKRKSQKSNAVAVPTKKYNYYVENFEEGKKKEPRSTSAAPERTNSGFNKNNQSGVEEPQSFAKPQLNNSNHQLLESTPNQNKHRPVSPIDNYNDRNSEQNQPKSNKQAAKKQFLTRGSGTAGGKQGHSNPVLTQKQKAQQQKQSQKKNNPLLSDDEYPNDFNFAAEQDNKSPKLNNPYLSRQQAVANNKRSTVEELNRNSIAEFEKLEQECSKQANQTVAVAKQPVTVVQQSHYQKQQQKPNQKRRKLFDDSDSNGSEDDEIDDNNHQNISQHILEENKAHNKSGMLTGSHANSENEENSKSSIVKKFFYKEDPSKKPPSQIPRIPPSIQSDPSSQLEAAMKQKMEQLDRTIEAYNQQTEAAQKMKREYESLVSKQRVDFRDFEGKKKKEMEDLDRLRNEELEKLRKEKKALEQRQKNMQLVQTSNKKEREEIEFLKRELLRVQEEAKAKDVKAKTQIERLTKQCEEYKQRNKELQDELKHLSEQMIAQSNKSAAQQRNSNNPNNVSGSSASQAAAQAAASRYTFSANNNKSQEQLNTPQQPKSILKNKVEEQRPVSSNYFYNEPLEEDKYEDEEEEDEHHFGASDQGDGEHHNQSEEDEDSNRDKTNYNMSRQQNLGNLAASVRVEENNRNQQNISGMQASSSNPQPRVVEEEDETEDFDMKFPPQYHNKLPANMKVVEQTIGNDGKIQRVYENGKREVIFNNGVKREVFPDNYTIVYFNNNDIKQTYADQRVVYYFAEARTTQTTFADGLQVFKFANNQIEKHFPDGTKEIIFPDGTIKCIFADGEEESIFPDGTIQRIEKNGVKAIEFANGQKDIMFPDGTKIREYPDGKVRKTYPDGKTEYSHRQTSQQQ